MLDKRPVVQESAGEHILFILRQVWHVAQAVDANAWSFTATRRPARGWNWMKLEWSISTYVITAMKLYLHPRYFSLPHIKDVPLLRSLRCMSLLYGKPHQFGATDIASGNWTPCWRYLGISGNEQWQVYFVPIHIASPFHSLIFIGSDIHNTGRT